MCGIFGFSTTGERDSSVVIEGLKELEYRGYDSWGLAVASGNRVLTEKQIGKIGGAQTTLPATKAALGHTRWATHGGVTQANAHPHMDCGQGLAVIHNGIVENHAELRRGLEGHRFHSQTDTEVVVHLLEDELNRGNGSPKADEHLVKGLMSTFSKLNGLSAVAVLEGETGNIAAAKNGSPLVVGIGEDGCYLASDPVALLPHTRKLVFIEDGQAVTLTSGGPRIYDIESGREIDADVRDVDWVTHGRELGPYEHYLIKEINEQPQVLRNLAATTHEGVEELAFRMRQASEVFITGCGTANNAGLAAQPLFAKIAGMRVTAVMASEMAVIAPLLRPNALVITLSQSGETIDVLDAARQAKQGGASIVSLTNSEGSTLDRMADMTILLKCGPERCVLSTKTYTAKIAVLLMTAYAVAGKAEEGRRIVAEGSMLIESKLVDESDHHSMATLAERISGASNIFVLGRHIGYPLALEAALKIKEVSYIHAEGFASGELKHGVIALIEPGTPCLIIALEEETLKATLAGASEVAARGAFTIGMSHQSHPEFAAQVPLHGADGSAVFEVAACFQLLAYHLALQLHRDPDKPRNLAKSVTVR